MNTVITINMKIGNSTVTIKESVKLETIKLENSSFKPLFDREKVIWQTKAIILRKITELKKAFPELAISEKTFKDHISDIKTNIGNWKVEIGNL